MVSNKTKPILYPGDVWVISKGKYVNLDLNGINDGNQKKGTLSCREERVRGHYRILCIT